VWPGIFLGQFLLALSEGLAIVPATSISAINSIEALIAATLFIHFGLQPSLARIKDVFGLLLLITFILQPFSATFGNLALLMGSIINLQQFPTSWFSWWFGNAMGQMLITPMMLLFYASRQQIRAIELLVVAIFFGVVGYLLLQVFSIESLSIMLSITSPLIVLVAVYKGAAFATLATAVLAVMSMHSTHIGIGVFTLNGKTNIVDLNFFIINLIILSLFIGLLVTSLKEK